MSAQKLFLQRPDLVRDPADYVGQAPKFCRMAVKSDWLVRPSRFTSDQLERPRERSANIVHWPMSARFTTLSRLMSAEQAGCEASIVLSCAVKAS